MTIGDLGTGQSLSGDTRKEDEANDVPVLADESLVYRTAGKLHGRVALITGGESGMARAVARLFAREGADVAIIYAPAYEHDALVTARAVEAAGRQCLRIAGDMRDSVFCVAAVDRTIATLGALDVLVNNASASAAPALYAAVGDRHSPPFDTSIFGYFYLSRAALKHLPRGGAIVNTGSVAVVHAFTRSQATRLFDRGIRVNCVDQGPDAVGRSADAVAPSYVFLASAADSGCITGEVLTLVGRPA